MTFKEKMDLSRKNILITGAAGILGSRITEGLAEFGANLALYDIKQDKVQELAEKLKVKYGTKVIGYECDVSNPDVVKKIFSQTEKDFGEIHVLHNNAAYRSSNLDAYFEPFETYSFEEWKRGTDINIDGMFLVAQAVGKHMVEKKINGSVIQTCSIYGIVAPDQRIYEGSFYNGRKMGSPAQYSASKAAVHGLTKYLASYWGDKGIRVNSITPGGVESGQNETFKQRYSARIPMGRMAEADEVASAVIFLASDFSTYVTGQNLIVDGGLTAW